MPLDTAAITITPTDKKAPGTIQVADCATPKKPVISVTAGDTVDIPFERTIGADGITWQTPQLTGTVSGAVVTGAKPWKKKFVFPSQAAAEQFITDYFASTP